MHWEILIIPLIALGVWIVGTLFKSEDDKTKKGSGPVRGNASGRAPSRRPVTNLDRFLEEARRRREVEESPKAAPPPPPRPTVARPPLRERPSRPRETPPRAAAPVVRREEAPIAIPVARPVAPPLVVEPVPTTPPAGNVDVPGIAPTTTRDTRLSPILQEARSLLSKPQTAATAFVLREIFDRPLCKRRR